MKKITSLIFAIILIFSSVILLSACGIKIPNTKTDGILVVGMECDYAPFNWMEKEKTDTNYPISNITGKYAEGYDVQMAKKIADELGYELQIKVLAFSGLIPALKNGEIDLIISNMSPTDTRKKEISFTNGYYTTKYALLMKKESKFYNAQSLDDLKGAKIACKENTIFCAFEAQILEKGAVAGTDKETIDKLVIDIHTNIIDATIMEEVAAIEEVNKLTNANLGYILLDGNKALNISEEDEIISIGVRKEFQLTEQINTILSSISESERKTMMDNAVIAHSKAN